MTLSGGSLFRGTLANSAGLAVTIGSGSTFDVQTWERVDLASLAAGSGSSLGVTVGEAGHTLYNVAGAASFGSGSKIIVTLDHVGTAEGTYTILDAGTLTGAEKPHKLDHHAALPFRQQAHHGFGDGPDRARDRPEGIGLAGLNEAENAILDAALDARMRIRAFPRSS